MKIVTAINAKYFDNLKILSNSFRMNAGRPASSEKFELWCLVHGDTELESKVQDLGINTIRNPDMDDVIFPTSKSWPERIPAMYSRLWIPRLFHMDERVLWLDADCVIIDNIEEILSVEFNTHPILAPVIDMSHLGAQFCDWTLVKDKVKVRNAGAIVKYKGIKALAAGVMLFNIEKWNRRYITQQCVDVMHDLPPWEFKFVVQSVLNYVLQGNFGELDKKWHVSSNRLDVGVILGGGGKILHLLGGKGKGMAEEYWRHYEC